MVEWLYLDSGVKNGPVSSDKLKSLAGQGLISPWTPVRKVDGATLSPWKRAGEVKGLFPAEAAGQIGGPICPDCGRLLTPAGSCDQCRPLPPPVPKPVIASVPSPPVAPEAKRYRHLRMYLGIVEALARVSFAVILIVVGVGVVLGLYQYGWPRFSDAMGVIGMLLISFIWYLAAMASVQIVNVLLDIEASVRQTEVNTRQAKP